MLTAVDDAVHQQAEAGDGQQHPGDVHPAGSRVAGVGYHGQHRDQPGRHHRYVDQEDRAPPEVFEQQPADHRSDGDAEPDGARPGTDRAGALPRVEDVGDDRERRRQYRGAADAHQRAGGDELAGRLRVRGGDRCDAEQQQAEQQDLLAAEPVTEHAPGEQQPGEDQGVRVGGPLQVALGGTEAALRIRDYAERDVEDGRVEDDDQQADHQHAEDEPASRVAGGQSVVHEFPPSNRYEDVPYWYRPYGRTRRYGTVS